MLRHGILGLLNYGNMTGYEIMGVFRDSLSHFWAAQTSQIYRELQNLEKQGFVSVEHVPQESKPDKNVFAITESGREELLKWLRDETKGNGIRSPLMMKTFFRGECSPEENIQFFREIAAEADVFPKGKGVADQAKRQYENVIGDPRKALFWKFTIEYGVMYENMLREWCARCIKELEELIKAEGEGQS
ncbi:MAG: PadR family transcriptional regulator [Lachnospiraceae bacterium]|nr:PadR family transcriptional regulator [Lachnospiraceae bacterium]